MSEAHLGTAIDLYLKAGTLWDRVAAHSRSRKALRKGEPDLPGQVPRLPGEAAQGKALALLGIVEAYVLLGKNLDRARAMLDEAKCCYAGAGAGSYQMGHVESLYGSLALAEGDREQATKHFHEASETFRRLGFSLDGSGDTWK